MTFWRFVRSSTAPSIAPTHRRRLLCFRQSTTRSPSVTRRRKQPHPCRRRSKSRRVSTCEPSRPKHLSCRSPSSTTRKIRRCRLRVSRALAFGCIMFLSESKRRARWQSTSSTIARLAGSRSSSPSSSATSSASDRHGNTQLAFTLVSESGARQLCYVKILAADCPLNLNLTQTFVYQMRQFKQRSATLNRDLNEARRLRSPVDILPDEATLRAARAFKLHLVLPAGVGLSLVSAQAEELIYARLCGVEAQLCESKGTYTLSGYVNVIQVRRCAKTTTRTSLIYALDGQSADGR